MIRQVCLATRVLKFPRIDEIIEAQMIFDIGLIREVANPLAQPARQAIDIFEGLFPKDGQTEIPVVTEATKARAQKEGFHTRVADTFSARPPVQSMPPRPWGMPSDVMMISQATWTDVVTQLGMIL